ncbi:MAG TPA: hypothetical protein VE987_04260 [Polyangiaceae bacterium]|nr:hypothetical protein [Polyangiaceae bacterium]
MDREALTPVIPLPATDVSDQKRPGDGGLEIDVAFEDAAAAPGEPAVPEGPAISRELQGSGASELVGASEGASSYAEPLLPATPRDAMASSSSLRPVGIEVAPLGSNTQLLAALVADPHVQRRRFTRLVYGICIACGALVVAAVAVRFTAAHRRHVASLQRPAPAAAPPVEPAPLHAEGSAGPATNTASVEQGAARPAVADEATRPGLDVPPAVGTLVLRRPAAPGNVWLDGAKLTAASTSVACGPHEIRIGKHGRPKHVTVPCGGELRLAR